MLAHNANLTPPLCIDVFVPSNESERSCIVVSSVSMLHLSMNLLFSGTVPTVWHLCFTFDYIIKNVYLSYIERKSGMIEYCYTVFHFFGLISSLIRY